MHDRTKEVPKAMKQLTRLFPNKVTIQIPQVHCSHNFQLLRAIGNNQLHALPIEKLWQDESQLSDWKQLLDRDVETLKAKSNILSLRSVSWASLLHYWT